MDYYQGVVVEYLRANRATFVNTEFWLILKPDEKEPPKGTSWFVDIVAVNFHEKTAYLCEVTYSATQGALRKKLLTWSSQWSEIQDAVRRDARLPQDWSIDLWLFVPEDKAKKFKETMPQIFKEARLTCLEKTVPWKYNNYDKKDDEFLKEELIQSV